MLITPSNTAVPRSASNSHFITMHEDSLWLRSILLACLACLWLTQNLQYYYVNSGCFCQGNNRAVTIGRWCYTCCYNCQVMLHVLLQLSGDVTCAVTFVRWCYMCCYNCQVMLHVLLQLSGDVTCAVTIVRWCYMCCYNCQVMLHVLLQLSGDVTRFRWQVLSSFRHSGSWAGGCRLQCTNFSSLAEYYMSAMLLLKCDG